MDIALLLILSVTAFFAAIISAIAGFGSGLIMIVILSFFFDIKTAVAIGSVLFLFVNINKTFLFYKTVDWSFAKNILIGAFPGCLIGFIGFDLVNPIFIQYMLAGMGIFMIAKHFWHLTKNIKPNKSSPNMTKLKGFGFGVLAGLGSAALAKTYILKSEGFKKEFFIGTGVIITLTMNLTKMPIFIYTGYLDPKYIISLFPIFFTILAGSWIGKNILNNISNTLFEKIVLIIVALSVVKFLFF